MMTGDINAEIGHWYRPSGSNDMFEVIAIDENDQTVELQHFDGEIEAVDYLGWQSIFPIEAAPPEDWTGPFEIETDDSAWNDYSVNDAMIQLERDYR